MYMQICCTLTYKRGPMHTRIQLLCALWLQQFDQFHPLWFRFLMVLLTFHRDTYFSDIAPLCPFFPPSSLFYPFVPTNHILFPQTNSLIQWSLHPNPLISPTPHHTSKWAHLAQTWHNGETPTSLHISNPTWHIAHYCGNLHAHVKLWAR